MTLQQLRYVVTIAEIGTISKAAEELFVSQPSLTKALKELEKEMAAGGYQFSSANSINIGRLVPQIVYYVYAYAKLYANGVIAKDEPVNVVVPTGNFGNILACHYAGKMGIPVGKLICASNSNNVLTDFLATGTYDKNRPFHTTMSPSMDILVSSNLERLLFALSGQNDQEVAGYMKQLGEKGCYTVSEEIKAKLEEAGAAVTLK